MKQGELIATTALTWVGTPYMNYAMVKGRGVDCAHLILGVLLESGLLHDGDLRIEQYSNEWHLHRSEEKFIKHIRKIANEVDSPQIGDFLLYQYGRCVSHGAILVAPGGVAHAFVDQGVILSKLDDVLFYDAKGRHRLRHIYRFNGKGET